MLDFQFFARRKTSIVLDYHNVIVCLDNRLVVYSSRGETASPEESRVFSSFLSLFLLFFFFYFFSIFAKKFSIRNISSYYFFYYSMRVFCFFFFLLQQILRKISLEGKIVARNSIHDDLIPSRFFLFFLSTIGVRGFFSREKNLETFNFNFIIFTTREYK